METDRAKLRLVQAETLAADAADLRWSDAPAADRRLSFPMPSPAQVAAIHAVRLLSLDAHGRVLDWMSWQDAACLYARGAVAWTLGDPCITVHGGTCRATGAQSLI